MRGRRGSCCAPPARAAGCEARPEQAAGVRRHRHRRYGRVLPRGVRSRHARQGTRLQGAERRIGKGALVVTDKAGAYPAVLKRLGATLERTDATEHAINRINSLHARFKDFIYDFKGLSTKHLQSYLAWFQWTEAFKRADPPSSGASSAARFATACTGSCAECTCTCPCWCDG